MDLTFVICTFNGAARLPETLGHLLAQRNLDSHDWEVIVVDNASTDATADIATKAARQFPAPLRVLREPKPGKTHALRTGLQAAQGRYFTIVDDDNHLCPDWLDEAVVFLDAHPKAGLIGGKILPSFDSGVVPPPDFDTRFAQLLAIRDLGDEPRSGVAPIGAGMTGRTELMPWLYTDLGCFLEDRVGSGVGCCEDIEKAIMVERLGWESWYVPALSMHHYMPPGRLTDEYIDRLWAASTATLPWLNFLKSRAEPGSIEFLRRVLIELPDVCRESMLCIPPATLHKRFKAARYFRKFYLGKLAMALSMYRRRDEIARMLWTVNTAPAHMRPLSHGAAFRSPMNIGAA